MRSIGFYTVQFLEKFAIDLEISKEFFAINRFIYCSLMYIFCTVNFSIDRKNSFEILRSIAIFSRNCTENKLIDRKNSFEISRLIADFSRNCSVKTDRLQKIPWKFLNQFFFTNFLTDFNFSTIMKFIK